MTRFGAHSTRAASASKALTTGVPLDIVMKQGGWSSLSIFIRHYRRDIKGTTPSPALSAKEKASAGVHDAMINWTRFYGRSYSYSRAKKAAAKKIHLRRSGISLYSPATYHGGLTPQFQHGNETPSTICDSPRPAVPASPAPSSSEMEQMNSPGGLILRFKKKPKIAPRRHMSKKDAKTIALNLKKQAPFLESSADSAAESETSPSQEGQCTQDQLPRDSPLF